MSIFLTVVLLALASLSNADTCGKATITSTQYANEDSTIMKDGVLIVNFQLQCSNPKVTDLILYAEFNGKTTIVASSGNGYQVSFTDSTGAFPSGEQTLRIFDEDGFTAYNKAQRFGDDISKVQSIGDIKVKTGKSWKGIHVHVETIILVGLLTAVYLAYSQKASLVR